MGGGGGQVAPRAILLPSLLPSGGACDFSRSPDTGLNPGARSTPYNWLPVRQPCLINCPP